MNATRTEHLFERWLICIPGYMQRRGDPGAGVPALHRELSAAYNGPTCRVDLFLWDSKWRDLARWIDQSSIRAARIDVFAYSWGVGFGFLRLAKYLRRHGREIQNAVLCDGVAHVGPGLGPFHTASKSLAFLPCWSIRIPDNVRAVHRLRQENSLLRGHPIHRADPNRTRLATPIYDVHRVHATMDDSPAFFGLCKEIAGGPE